MKQTKTASGVVLLSGASSGIGRETARQLLECGYEIYGIGRSFKEEDAGWQGSGFHRIELDMCHTQELYRCVTELCRQRELFALINNAGAAYYGLHETLNPEKIHEMVTVNLEIPMTLTQIALRNLKRTQGYVINISSVTAHQANPHGCAYGATKAGLTSFGESLFAEARKYGVHVCTIHPDMVKTGLYRNADFQEAESPDAYLESEEVASAVCAVLEAPPEMSVTELTIRPQKHQIHRKKQERD